MIRVDCAFCPQHHPLRVKCSRCGQSATQLDSKFYRCNSCGRLDVLRPGISHGICYLAAHNLLMENARLMENRAMHIVEPNPTVPTLADLFPSAQIAAERRTSNPISAAILAGGVTFGLSMLAYSLWRSL